MGNYFSAERFINVFPKVISNLSVNLHIVFWSMLLGTILAIFVAVLRIRRVPVISGLLGIYISFMRGTPLLVQMMIAFYGIPIVLGNLFMNLFGINEQIFCFFIFDYICSNTMFSFFRYNSYWIGCFYLSF